MTNDHAAHVRAAILNPTARYGSPEEVERDAGLGREEKLAILESWEEDAHELAVAEEENMGGGEPNRLDEVVAVRNRLTGGKETARAGPVRQRVRRFTKPVGETIHADHEIDEATLKLSLQEHPVLPVVDADQIVGLLGRVEMAKAAEEQDGEVRLTARVMMTTDLAFCYLDDEIATALALMDKHRCNHLMVLDREHVLVGTVQRDDLPAVSAHDSEAAQRRSEAVDPREEHTQGVANTIQPGGLDVYDESPTIRAPHG